MRRIFRLLLLLAVLGPCGPVWPAGEAALEVAVVGQVAKSYKRQKLPDGTLKPERYALANGGPFKGTSRDMSAEKVAFPVIGLVVSRHLAKQKYVLAEKAEDTDLLIVLRWGNTLGSENTNYSQSVQRNAAALDAMKTVDQKLEALKQPSLDGSATEDRDILLGERQRASDNLESSITMTNLENKSRDMANLDNAKVLGYLDAINAHRDVLFSEISGTAHDLMRDVEEKRYYVTVSAYDFRAIREKKKDTLCWVTRISIRAAGNSFDERMAQMIASAASTFGQKKDLSRRYYGDPRVELGEVEYLGVAAAPTPAEAAPRAQPEK